MASVSAVAFTAVLLCVSVVPLCAAKCAFTVQVGLAIDSKLSMKIANVSLLKDCLLFLEHHADSYAAVAYNEVSLDCCTVPTEESYKLIESAGWSTYYIEQQQQQAENGSSIYTSSGQFTVPAGVTTLKVLAVGGGAGGAAYFGGGGGSGYVAFGVVKVTPSQTIEVTVGAGGQSNKNGQRTVFGNNLVAAEGGKVKSSDYHGGDGGSGGGAGSYRGYTGSGGSGGSDGNSSTVGSTGGYGQAWSFTAYFNEFHYNTLSAGIGAAGISVFNETYWFGGGGGGGVLINGAGISSSNSECYIDGVWYGSGPASGYGAGGSGGCLNNYNGYSYLGGAGASGLVYIEYLT